MWCSLLRVEDGIRNIYVVLTVVRVEDGIHTVLNIKKIIDVKCTENLILMCST